MSQFSLSDIEIIGFDGTVRVECARESAVARHKKTGRYFRFPISETDQQPTEYGKDELVAFRDEHRLTLLPNPVAACEHAMVIYVTGRFLEVYGRENSNDLCEQWQWQKLECAPAKASAWAAVVSAEELEERMNTWASDLQNESERLLEDFFLSKNETSRSSAENVADIALCAARDSNLRFEIYVRYGAAISLSARHQRTDSLLRYFIAREYPKINQETYFQRVSTLVSSLKVRAVAGQHGSPLLVQTGYTIGFPFPSEAVGELSRNVSTLDARITTGEWNHAKLYNRIEAIESLLSNKSDAVSNLVQKM